MKKITVYGSLLEGASAHHILRDAKQLFKGVKQLPYKMIDFGEFPGLIKEKNNKVNDIYVETYEVSDVVFYLVEYYEGYPTLYTRDELEDGSYIYILNNVSIDLYESHQHITDWLYYKEKRDAIRQEETKKYYFTK